MRPTLHFFWKKDSKVAVNLNFQKKKKINPLKLIIFLKKKFYIKKRGQTGSTRDPILPVDSAF